MRALTIRLPNLVHQKVRELAERDAISVNQFIASARNSRSLCTKSAPCSIAMAAIRQSVDLQIVSSFLRADR